MKPRPFIAIHYLELGGAEASLIALLRALDYNKVDVDLFVHAHRGELMSMIPKEVNLLPEIKRYRVLEDFIIICALRGQIDIAYYRLKAKIKNMQYYRSHPSVCDDEDAYFFSQYTTPLLPPINPDVEYDLAISFLTPHKIVLDKVRAQKKVAWIHTDYKTLKVAKELVLPIWSQYNKIVSISRDVTKSFLYVFPSLSNKIIEIENIISQKDVKEKSNLIDVSDVISSGYINFMSIGRFTHQKNFDNIPNIARRIVEAGYDNLKWYIIGFGDDESLIRRKIAEEDMKKHVIILGKKENPYPYIKACDIYVQPSRYEGKSIAVREAQILCKPVVITNYATAHSQVQDGVDGVIVPMDNEGCAKGITNFIENKELQNNLVAYLSTHDYGNEQEVEKIYALI